MTLETENNTFDLRQLSELAGLSRRTVRFYIQKGLVDRPIGQKRAARYTREHLRQLLAIQKWQDAGVSLERIGELLQEGGPAPLRDLESQTQPGDLSVWSRLTIADGIELHVNAERAGLSPSKARQLARTVHELYCDLVDQESTETAGGTH